WLMNRKEVLQDALPASLQGPMTDRIFDWWDEQLTTTVVLTILGFTLYFFLLRGFTRGFLYAAAAIVVLFLLVNGLVIGSGFVYISRNPGYMTNWLDIVRYGSRNPDPLTFALGLTLLAVKYLPAATLGLSGFELSMASAPLVRGRAGDDPARPRGRI